jgi:protein O-GlcNAc transferase
MMNKQEIDRNLVMADYYLKNNNIAMSKPLLYDILNADSHHSKTNELLSHILAHEGNLEAAHHHLMIACQAQTCSVEALYYLGASFLSFGKYQDARDYFEKSLNKGGDFFEGIHDLAVAHACLGNKELALDGFIKALSLNPNSAELHFNIARLYDDLKQFERAISYYDDAIILEPGYYQAWSNKGISLKELGHLEDAINCYNKAIDLMPDYAEAWSNKGNVLQDLKQYDQALACYDKAITLKPNYPQAWSNKGTLLAVLNRSQEALACYDMASNLETNYAEAWFNKGVLLATLKRFPDSIPCYLKALKLKPQYPYALSNLLNAKLQICEWDNFDKYSKEIYENASRKSDVIAPFHALSLTDDESLHFNIAQNWSKKFSSLEAPLEEIKKIQPKEKIRVAYYSSDFYNHPVAHLIAELIELHDRNTFHIIAFSFKSAPADDPMRSRLEGAFDQFIDVQSMSNKDVAILSREMQIDIAVDLLGFTANARTNIFAYRAAPIQINYLGYPGTMGANYYDYIIADPILIPRDSQKFYSEKIAYLPNCYQANDRKRPISTQKFSRIELGLPAQGFVFCCFNNNFKILPDRFDSWMRILKATDGSVLWLLEDTESVCENLKREAENRGVASDRLIFAKRMPMPDHLARHQLADLFLDTAPYNAHTTASDALWAGLPILTRPGQSFASRVASSLLCAIELPELVAHTQDEYESLAIELARDSQKLSSIRKKLQNNRLTTALFDTELFCNRIESLYKQMVTCNLEDKPPKDIFA